MNTLKRISALALTASMALSMLTPAWAAEKTTAATGELQAAVRIDYSQTLAELKERAIKAELFQGGKPLGSAFLTEPGEAEMPGYTAQVSLRDQQGGEHNGTAAPGALDLTVSGLPQGNYILRLTGEGYAQRDVPFNIDKYSKYIEVGTGDGTFALGDFDKNDRVDAKDREALANALGSTADKDLYTYDLNGDREIDIVDLAYVNRSVNVSTAVPTVLDTACITAQVNLTKTQEDLTQAGTTVDGNLAKLLEEEETVNFKRTSGTGDIVIPVQLTGEVEAENLQITTPDGVAGTIQEGRVTVETESGETITRSFSVNTARYANVHAITPDPGHSVITIPLGKRVAVKKITITVTKTADGNYATVESIRFLKDIAPEGLTEPNSVVKNLSAIPGDGQVTLRWNELPNVSGYRVDYWEKDKDTGRRQLNVDTASAQVTGLDNLKTYCFTVTPTDGSWEGTACAPVEETPQPAKAPDPPDMVSVAPLDGQLAVSWKKGSSALWYEVYYLLSLRCGGQRRGPQRPVQDRRGHPQGHRLQPSGGHPQRGHPGGWGY